MRDGRLPDIGPYAIRSAVSFCLDHKIPEGHIVRCSCTESAGAGDRDLQGKRCGDSPRTRGTRACAFVRIGTSTLIALTSDAVYQGEVVEEADDGVSSHSESVLGSSCMGPGVFCGNIGECDRRSGEGVYPVTTRRRAQRWGAKV